MAQQTTTKKPRQPKKTTAPDQKTKPGQHTTTDEIDGWLEEIDAVLDEVAGGETSEHAQMFVKGYIQKGGQ